jgi:hypothetical protein
MSLLSGASLSVGFVIFSSGVSLGVGMPFFNESCFWGNSSCWLLIFGRQRSFWEDIFLMSLLSGTSLSAGFAISCLGVSQCVFLLGRAFLLGLRFPGWV